MRSTPRTILGLSLVACSFAAPCRGADEKAPAGGQNAAAEKPPEPPGPSVSASGTVVDAAGKPIASATVYLREWSLLRYSQNPYDARPHDLLATTKTDGRGAFSFENVPSRAFAKHSHFSAPWDVLATAPGHGLTGRHLVSADDQQRLQIALPGEKSVGGQVLDEHGKSVAGVLVSVGSIDALDSDPYSGYADPGLLHLSFSELTPRTRTAADGRFQIAGIPADRRLSLEFEHDDFIREHVFAAATDQPVPDVKVRDFVDGKAVMKMRPVESGDLTVKLRPGRKLAGQVVFADTRRPAADAKVMLFRQGRTWQAIADAEGRFALSGISEPNMLSLSVYLPGSGDYLNRRLPIDFIPDQRRLNVEVALPRGNPLEGLVVDDETGNGIAGVKVTDSAAGQDEFNPGRDDRLVSAAATTDATGRFRLSVPPGQRMIRISGPVAGYDLPDRVSVRRNRWRQIEQSIEVVAGQPAPELKFHVGRGLVVEGLITDPAGKPVAGADVRRFAPREFPEGDATARTDAAGRFRIGGFPTGTPLRLIVSHTERKLKGRIDIPAADGEPGKKRIVPVELTLEPAGRVMGLATDGERPLAGIRVTLFEAFTENGSRMSGSSGVETQTGADGRFVLDLVEAGREFTVSIHEDGFEHVFPRPFTVKPGESFEHPLVTMRRLDQTVSGIVVDPDGNPVEGATIAASDRKTRRSISLYRGESTVSGIDGRFTMRHLPNAPLSLMAYIPPPADAADRTIRFPASADADPGDTDVKLILDPKLSRSRAKKVKIEDNPKKPGAGFQPQPE